jgi:hypothetical protein
MELAMELALALALHSILQGEVHYLAMALLEKVQHLAIVQILEREQGRNKANMQDFAKEEYYKIVEVLY